MLTFGRDEDDDLPPVEVVSLGTPAVDEHPVDPELQPGLAGIDVGVERRSHRRSAHARRVAH